MRLIHLFLLLLPNILFGQTSDNSHVILHVDKNICYPGDTIWFRGYCFNNDETNLYVELYSDSSTLISRNIFPVINYTSLGNIIIPRKAGYYWLRSYTYNSKLFVLPISVVNESKIIVARKLPFQQKQMYAPTITLTEEKDSINVKIQDSMRYSLSISVTDPKIPRPAYTLINSATQTKPPEAEYLNYTGIVSLNNKNIK